MESTHLLRSQINLAFQHADCSNKDGNQDKINNDVMAIVLVSHSFIIVVFYYYFKFVKERYLFA